MFARIYRESQNKEILFNLDHISMIEVTYATKTKDAYFFLSLRDGVANPDAIRMYRVHVAGDKFLFAGDNPDDPLTKALGDIYAKSLKGNPKEPNA